jgi:hypothetical protein
MAQTTETRPGGAGSGNAVYLGGEWPSVTIPPQKKQRKSGGRAMRQRGIDARARLRRQRLVEHLHRLGPAPLGHFLREVENGASNSDHLERYSRIDPEFVRALGGDRYAPALHVVERR